MPLDTYIQYADLRPELYTKKNSNNLANYFTVSQGYFVKGTFI